MKRYFSYIKKGVFAGAALATLVLSGYALQSSGSQAATLPRDCEATAIIYCGSTSVSELISDYNSRDGGRYPDIPAVFNHFGISASDIQNMGGSYKMGKVRADGTVWIGSQKIGVNAVTAGRSVKPGSVAIPGTGAYTRSPSVSFAQPSTEIDAFIGFKNGVPTWAVLASCGNPVKWDKPELSIEKTVRNAANTAWVENDTFANNSTLTYRLVIKNTGKVDDTNVIVKDTLPAHHTFTKGSVKVAGAAKGAAGDALVGSGLNIGTVKAGATVEITFTAKVSVPDTKCGDTAFINKAVVDGHLTPPDEDTAGGKVRVLCAVVKCESLTADKTAIKLGESVTYKATASVQHATVQSYEFRVNNAVVQNTASDTLVYKPTALGDHKVKVTVITDKGNATSANCEKTLSVTQDVVFKCVSLTADKLNLKVGEKAVLTAKAEAVNATIQSYEFRVNNVVVQDASSATYTFTADEVGSHTVKVTVKTDKGNATSADCEKKLDVTQDVVFRCVSLTSDKLGLKIGERAVLTARSEVTNATVQSYEFRVNDVVVQDTSSATYTYTADKTGTHVVKVTVKTDKGNVTSTDCEVRIAVDEEPKCPYNPELPANSPDCKKPEVCPHNPNLPKDSPDCKAPEPEQPEEPEVLGKTLPSTGAGSVIGLFSATTILGTLAHRALSLRRDGR